MKKYEVYVIETISWIFEDIEAESEDEAQEIAMDHWEYGKQVDCHVEDIEVTEIKE